MSWWFIRRQKEDQPTGWINESAGVIRHDEETLEVYHVDIGEKVKEADHVKTNDESIVPGHLTIKNGWRSKSRSAAR